MGRTSVPIDFLQRDASVHATALAASDRSRDTPPSFPEEKFTATPTWRHRRARERLVTDMDAIFPYAFGALIVAIAVGIGVAIMVW
jgi:hypothetical protein